MDLTQPSGGTRSTEGQFAQEPDVSRTKKTPPASDNGGDEIKELEAQRDELFRAHKVAKLKKQIEKLQAGEEIQSDNDKPGVDRMLAEDGKVSDPASTTAPRLLNTEISCDN